MFKLHVYLLIIPLPNVSILPYRNRFMNYVKYLVRYSREKMRMTMANVTSLIQSLEKCYLPMWSTLSCGICLPSRVAQNVFGCQIWSLQLSRRLKNLDLTNKVLILAQMNTNKGSRIYWHYTKKFSGQSESKQNVQKVTGFLPWYIQSREKSLLLTPLSRHRDSKKFTRFKIAISIVRFSQYLEFLIGLSHLISLQHLSTFLDSILEPHPKPWQCDCVAQELSPQQSGGMLFKHSSCIHVHMHSRIL